MEIPLFRVEPEWDLLCEALRLRASRLSYPGFALLVTRLLRAYSYQNVQPVGRRSFKGPSRECGVDMRATVGTGFDRVSVIIQLKRYRYRYNISCQMVDTLRGVECRDRAG